jgi:hypothetical protein
MRALRRVHSVPNVAAHDLNGRILCTVLRHVPIPSGKQIDNVNCDPNGVHT